MKATKKLVALVLAVCMLVGMPLSIDVSAAGGTATDDPTTFELLYAYPATDDMVMSDNAAILAKEGQTITIGDETLTQEQLKGRVLLLAFNGPISNSFNTDASKGDVIYSSVRLAIEDADGNVIHNLNYWNVGPYFSGASNPYYFVLQSGVTLTNPDDETQTATINTFDDVFALLEGDGMYAGKGYKLVYRLWERGDAAVVTGNDGYVQPYYNTNLTDLKLVANTTMSADGQDMDCVAIDVTPVDEMPRLENVVRVASDQLMIQFSEGISWRNGFQGVRIVNSEGKLLCYSATGWGDDASNKYAIQSSGHLQVAAKPTDGKAFTYVSVNLTGAFGSTGLSIDQHLAAAQAEDPDAGYYLAYDLESSEWSADVCNANRGEFKYNFIADNYWTTNGEKPLLATASSSALGLHDSVLVPIQSYEDFKAANTDEYLFIENVTEVLDDTSSTVHIKFSDPVSNANTGSNRYIAVRIYNKNNALMYVTSDGTPTTATSGNTPCQWGIGGFAYYSPADSSEMIWGGGVTAKTSAPLDAAGNTATSIRAWMDSVGMTREAGYKLCISISHTNTTDTPALDGKVESFWSTTDSSKKLFANGNAGEERAYAEIEFADYESVQVERVNVLNNNYVLIYLNQDVTINNGYYAAMALSPGGNTLAWYDESAGYNTSTGTDLQAALSLSYFGNSQNVLLGTFGTRSADPTVNRSWAWLQQHLENAGSGYQIVLRMNDDATKLTNAGIDECEYVLDAFVGSGKYAKIHTGNTGFNVKNFSMDTDVLSAVGLTIIDGNTAMVEFNKAVTTIDTSNMTIWLTKYKMANGDRLFNAYTTAATGLWHSQINASTVRMADANGNAVTADSSKYWIMDLNDTTALSTAATQTKIQTEWTYGIRFERASDRQQGLIPNVVAADGSYLATNSIEAADYRHFVELDVDTAIDPVEIVDVTILDNYTMQVTFSRPVRHLVGSGIAEGANGLVNIRIVDKYNRVLNGYIEISSEWQPVDEDGDGFASVVNLVITSDSNSYWAADGVGIRTFARNYFYMSGVGSDWWGDGTNTLCVGFDDPTDATAGDGYVSAICDVNGNYLGASTYYAETPDVTYTSSRNVESALFSLTQDDYILIPDAEVTAEAVTSHNGADAIVLSTPGMQDVSATSRTVRVYNGTTLVQIDGEDAIWTTGAFSNYNNANNRFAAVIHENFGCDSIAEIEALLAEKNIEYTGIYYTIHEITTAADRLGDGNIYKFNAANNEFFRPLKADIIDSVNGDIALIPIVDGTTESAHITDVTVHKNNANSNYIMEINFSHALSDKLIESIQSGALDVWITAKHTTVYDFVSTTTGEVDAAAANISQRQISPSELNMTNDKQLVATVSADAYETVKNAVDTINASYPGSAELAIRMEHDIAPVTTNAHIESGYLVPTDSTVLSALMQTSWGKQRGRVWADMTEGEAVNAQVIVNGVYQTDALSEIEAATDGDHLILVDNIEVVGTVGVNVLPGVVLDLNGKTLDMGAGTIVATGHIIDSTEGGALIVMSQDTTNQFAVFATDNPQLPLYDNTNSGYRLYTVALTNKGTKGSDTSDYVQYGMHLDMSDFALLAQTDNGGATVTIDLTSEELKNGYLSTVFSAETVKYYADTVTDTTVFYLGISGMNKLEDRSSLTVTATITSAGVTKTVTIE